MNHFNRILKTPGKEAAKARGVLSRLYRQILADVGVNPTVLHRLMSQYLDDPSNGINNDPIKRSYVRQNFVNALAGEDMTWKTFMKGMLLVLPIDFEISVKARWTEKQITVTKVLVNVRQKDEPFWMDDVVGHTGLEGELEEEQYPEGPLDQYNQFTTSAFETLYQEYLENRPEGESDNDPLL